MRAFIEEHRTQTTPFDIIVEGETPGDDPEKAAAIVRGREEAGATWWIESMWEAMAEHSPVTAAYDRLRQGPPE